MAFQCEDQTNITKEQEQQELATLKQAIENLAKTAVCNENTACKFIALGSKPCGGPWSYLIYSASINVDELENLVENYNQKEALFNTKYGVISDCSFLMPPNGLGCENNTCIPIY